MRIPMAVTTPPSSHIAADIFCPGPLLSLRAWPHLGPAIRGTFGFHELQLRAVRILAFVLIGLRGLVAKITVFQPHW